MAERLSVSLRFISSDARAREIAEFYWAQEEDGTYAYKVSDVADLFEVSKRDIIAIVNEVAVAESVSERCDRCDEPRAVRSRHDAGFRWHASRRWGGKRLCPSCVRELEDEEISEREAELERQRERLTAAYPAPDGHPPLDVSTLSLRQATTLLALIRVGADEGMTRIGPLKHVAHRWAPGAEFPYELLREINGDVLWVDAAQSPLDAFVWEDGRSSYYLDEVAWRVPGPNGDLGRVGTSLEAIFASKDWPLHWQSESEHLRVELAAHEVLEYLVERLREHGFTFSPGEKSWEIAVSMSEQLSIGQSYNLVWRAAKDAASFYLRENCEKSRASGYAIGTLRRMLERATTADWELPHYNRSWTIDESQMVHLLFRGFLGEEDPMSALPADA